MPLLFFTVPANDPDRAAAELNQCLATQRVAQVEKNFVTAGGGSFWSVCVTVVEGGAVRRDERSDAGRRRAAGSIDYRELLGAEEFALYDKLRSARKQAAEAEGLPTYAVFTNEQLAAMVQQRMTTAAALQAIDGIGEGRIARYGETFLALLRDGVPRLSPAPATRGARSTGLGFGHAHAHSLACGHGPGHAHAHTCGHGPGALMPQRQRLDLPDVAAAPNLSAALWSAARGKHARPDVAAFLADAAARLLPVRDALLAGRLPDGGLRCFAIRDPKPRLIHAAPFADRVAHHALMRLMEPRLEQALVPTSFACRPGRGVHAALRYAQAMMQRHAGGWVVQLDVWHCFPQIPHAGLLALLERRFKGSALQLVRHIVHAHEALPGAGRGLPIGSLTSQHFANQYLGEIDRFALAHPGCNGHVRYMDDVLLWCADRSVAHALAATVAAFCDNTLGLVLKPPRLAPVRAGLAFCGMRLGPRGLRPGPRRRRAWAVRWRSLQHYWQAGLLDEGQAQRRAEVLRALCLPATPRAWQRAVMGAGFVMEAA